VLNLPIDIPAAGDFGGAYGAARLGLIAATGESFKKICTPPKTEKTVTPDKKVSAAYEDAYRDYARIYDATKELNHV
jgi:xylulokinase